MTWRIAELRARARTELAVVTDEPGLEADLLLCHQLSASRSHLLAWPERLVEPPSADAFLAAVRRRSSGWPLAYILGEREFFGLPLRVTPATLVPRPETELLVELTLSHVEDCKAPRLLDLGTGSGAVALALARSRPDAEVRATERSDAAAAVARDNARRLGLANVGIETGDYFRPLPAGCFDAIACNPPYVAEDEAAELSPDVHHEPPEALFAGTDGLDHIRRIVASAHPWLNPGAALLLEHGWRQGEAVRTLLEQAGFAAIGTAWDLAGHERVSFGTRL